VVTNLVRDPSVHNPGNEHAQILPIPPTSDKYAEHSDWVVMYLEAGEY